MEAQGSTTNLNRISPFFVVGLITVLGGALRIYELGHKSLWLDEAKLFWIAQGSWTEVIAHNSADNSAPPLYALLINLLSQLGTSEPTLRLISCTAGVLSIPAIFLLARRFVSLHPAYVTSMLVAISSPLVDLSQELREYSLTFLLAMLMVLSFSSFMDQPSWRRWIFVSACFSLGIYTQYGLALLAAGLNIVFIARAVMQTRRDAFERDAVFKWLLLQVVASVAVVAVYNLALKDQFQSGGFASTGYLADAYWSGSLGSLARLAFLGTLLLFGSAFSQVAVLTLACSLGVFRALQSGRGTMSLLLITVPVLITFLAACLRLYPYSGDRQVAFLLPGIFILAGYGIEQILELGRALPFSHSRLLVLVLLLGVLTPGVVDTLLKVRSSGTEHVRPLFHRIATNFAPGDRIYVGCRAEPAFRYYLRSQNDAPFNLTSNIVSFGGDGARLAQVLAQPGPVWLLLSHCGENEGQATYEAASLIRQGQVRLVAGGDDAWLYYGR